MSKQLAAPPHDLRRRDLPLRVVRASRLVRISRHGLGEPFFGKSGAFRFDSTSARARRFGTCYCGLDLLTAVAETVLHDELPARGAFQLSASDFASRFLVRFKGRELVLADLTGIGLKVLGGNGALSTIIPYDIPQLWSRAIHRHPQTVDGIYYMSRHLNDRPAVVIFDRAAGKFTESLVVPLSEAPQIRAAIATLRISFPFP